MDPDVSGLFCEPIGVVRTPFPDRVSAPCQPRAAREVHATIELFAGRGFEFAVEDLISWRHLWIVFWFHLNRGWRPKVLPPRSAHRRGVFATRSPHRPNPIGLSAVELTGVDGLSIRVRGADMVDGTPVLDIKPYVAYSDAITETTSGWLDTPSSPQGADDPIAKYRITYTEMARRQLDWLAGRGVDIETPLTHLLELGPRPHPYRRIRAERSGFRIAIHEWRAFFVIQTTTVSVDRIGTGYRPRQLAMDESPGLDIHRHFVQTFGWV